MSTEKISLRFAKNAIIGDLEQRLTDLEELNALVKHQIEALKRQVAQLQRWPAPTAPRSLETYQAIPVREPDREPPGTIKCHKD